MIFSLTGAEITTVAAAESKEPARAIASMSTTLTIRVVLFYVLSIFFVVAAVNWTTIQPGHSPFVAALNQIGIPGRGLGHEHHCSDGGFVLPQFRTLCHPRGRCSRWRPKATRQKP